eukprot:TRINITY_DN2711_c0_g3_i1.p1 TRINITY_DN2711_c0_g3~~TRINITY_DN2711_c0_g3_i1.p1  ORF type:complete len:297 (-),score=50.31 TRINITY_DN2711_c0_g3_i1:225-1115(-)
MISPQARNDKISIPGSSSSHHMQSSMLNSSVRSPSDFRTATENNIQRDDTLRTSKSPSCTEIRQPRKHGVCHKVAAQTKSVASLSSEAVPEQNGLIPVPDRSMFQIKSNADEMVFEKQRRSNVALRRNLYAEKLRSALKAVPADRLCQECNQNLRRQTHESVETCAEAEGNDSHQNFLFNNLLESPISKQEKGDAAETHQEPSEFYLNCPPERHSEGQVKYNYYKVFSPYANYHSLFPVKESSNCTSMIMPDSRASPSNSEMNTSKTGIAKRAFGFLFKGSIITNLLTSAVDSIAK